MGSDSSAGGGPPSLDPRVVSLGFVAAVLLVTFVGPDSYFGLSDDAVGWALFGGFIVWTIWRRRGGTDGERETDLTTPAAMGEHYRPTGEGHVDGVYRVVGTGDPVALLRVGDDSGRRLTTGEVIRVDLSRLETEFEAASDPDAGVSVSAGLRNALSGFYWSVRSVFR